MSDWSYRTEHTAEWRAGVVRHAIDPGFVHFKKIETILGPSGMAVIDDQIKRIPDGLPEWQRTLRIEHIYTRTMLMFCEVHKIRSLRENLAKRQGHLFCSNEEIGPARELAEGRVANEILLGDGSADRIEVHYSTRHIFGDTPRERLRDGGYTFAIIAELRRVDGNLFIFDPVVMGSPWLEADDAEHQGIEWYGSDYYEHFVEDFDEFAKVKATPDQPSAEPMRNISEAAVKSCIAELLGDQATKDWGGETSDYYTAHLRIGGRRVTAAFLLKGPARFTPMDLTHLGKKHDQIVRLAEEPADVLIIQHCHDILPVVRKTLRAFAVQPSRPRRYCLIDGRDSLRLLHAYDLYDKAVLLSAPT